MLFAAQPNSSSTDSYVICGFEGDPVAEKIAVLLDKPLQKIQNSQFNDTSSNIRIKLNEQNELENKKVCIIASNCRKLGKPINESTMEIFLAIDAAKQAGAKEINLYIPYLGNARQDKVSQSGEPLAAQLTMKLLEAAGASRITVLDIHNEAVFSALSKKASGTNKFAMKEFANRFKEMRASGISLDNLVVVAPDKGAIERATLFLNAMRTVGFTNIACAHFDKSRDSSMKGEVLSMELQEVTLSDEVRLTGKEANEYLKGKTAIVIDDLADTCGTLLKAISENIVKKYGAKESYAAITHGVLSGNALEKIARTVELKKMLITDSIPLRENAPDNLEVVSCAPVFADAIAFDMRT